MYNLAIYHTRRMLHDQVPSKSWEVCRRVQTALYTNSGIEIPLKHVSEYEYGTIPIVYGAMRGTAEVMQKALWSGVGYFYIDKGYEGAGHYDGKYRICHNHQFKADLYNSIVCPDYNKTVVVIKPSFQGCIFLPFYKIDPEAWTDGVIYQLRKQGFNNIIVSAKTGNFPKLKDVNYDYLVAHNSVTLYDAIRAGKGAANVYLESSRIWFYSDVSKRPKSWYLKDLTIENFMV